MANMLFDDIKYATASMGAVDHAAHPRQPAANDMVFYNEMYNSANQPHESYQSIANWLQGQPPYYMKALNQQAIEHFYKKGITFTVYSDASNTERVIPFDIIPRIITLKEWQVMESGCAQRIRALNAFLHDVYHEQDILRAGIISAEQVLGNTSFQPWMMGVDLVGKNYAQISGIDLVRHNDGKYYVLEDNLRTPSGVSYMLEGRSISRALMPELFEQQKVLSIEDYPSLLKQTLTESSPIETPFIVVLTPGCFNSAYYEHAFLAREMGVPLVNGFDLFVENNHVYLKGIFGKQKVDVIYRRVDDDYIDPLAFNPSSMLGVAGLMAAYRSGNVIIANAPGTGIADDKSIYPYVTDMIDFYLGEKPILENVKTWQCAKSEDLQYVLAHLPELVVKEAQGSGGYGMLIGPKASKAEISDFKAKLMASPEAYIAQPTLALSVCPTLVKEGIAPRHIDLRPFILSSPKQIRTVPGGLTRVALEAGSLVVNSSQGGGTKDTWVVDEQPVHASGA